MFARDFDEGAQWILVPFVAAGLAAIGLSVVVASSFALARLVKARSRFGPPASALLVAAILGFAVALPVTWRWDDGCNTHAATLPLASLPFTMLTRPESSVAYDDLRTDVLCFSSP